MCQEYIKKTKVCKVCGIEKPVSEFNCHHDKKGKIYYVTKCKVCTWFKTREFDYNNIDWCLKDDIHIIDCILNKKKNINDIAIDLNKSLLDICLRIKNVLKLSGQLKLLVILKCENCKTNYESNPSGVIRSDIHFCTKECYNDWIKDNPPPKKIIGIGECINCHKEFNIIANVPDQKFCCTECKSEYNYRENPKYENKICMNCNIEYTRRKQSGREYQNNYCSLECELEYKHKEKWEFRECEICGEEFECLKSSTQKMCSIQCQGKWQSIHLVGENANGYNHEWSIKDRTMACEWCGLEHEAKPYQIEFGRRFCSDKCRQEWFAKEFSISEENIDRARIQAVKNLSDGIMNKTNTNIQLIVNEILENLQIKYINEYNCKYVAIDNYLNELNLMIEAQGQFWHVDPRFYKEINYEIQVKRIKMDKIKHTYIKNNYKIEILYLWEDDIKEKPELCRKLIQLYIMNNGILDNYHSFNYSLINDKLESNNNLIIPYMEYKAEDIRNITDTTVKEKMSHKQLDKWITFNCEYCGIETEQLKSHHKGEHHYCSAECSGKARRGKPKRKK